MATDTEEKPKRKRIAFDVLANPSAINEFFLDSGAFSQRARAKKEFPKNPFLYYDRPEFQEYVDAYGAFVQKHQKSLDYYATVDVIYHPEKSWEVLKYLEKEYGIKPVPVIHFGTSVKWMEKYLEAGYDFVGLGGFSSTKGNRGEYLKWIGRCFQTVADKEGKPTIKIHGFAMTSYELLTQFPWYSVDSSSWVQFAAYGWVCFPRMTNGTFNFKRPPFALQVSEQAGTRKKQGKHYLTVSPEEREILRQWLAQNKIPIGGPDERGVLNDYKFRVKANLYYYEALAASLPPWPWAFKGRGSLRGFFH